jgi:hypothetical protein
MEIMKYNLQDFNNIIFDGFDFKLPEETLHLISVLALEVGSPTYIKTPIFKKREPNNGPGPGPGTGHNGTGTGMKRSRAKPTEIVNDEDWETIRSFHATKIEQKVGIDAKIDAIRSHLNKMSDKTYADLKAKIVAEIDAIMATDSDSDLSYVSSAIFDIASTNRFYSKLYADLYSELIVSHAFMKDAFDRSFHQYMDLFLHIESGDPDKDYDLFCKINKDNEKRKAMSAFLVNLTINGILEKEKLTHILCQLLEQVLENMVLENKKSIVDELAENIAILCAQKQALDIVNQRIQNGKTIDEVIQQVANSKSKTYPSLSNKSIFKFMDLVDA